MANLKYRVLLIVGLFVASVWALFPRTVVERVKRDGVFSYDTVRRVPLKRGLDLQGGMHLTLEVDESKQAVANKSEALDRALKVVRQRIDEFGVSEPVVQKLGEERIIVELPGVDDPVGIHWQHATGTGRTHVADDVGNHVRAGVLVEDADHPCRDEAQYGQPSHAP